MGYRLEVFIRLVRQVVMRLVRLGLVLGVVSLSFRIHLFANGVEVEVNPIRLRRVIINGANLYKVIGMINL